MKTIEERAKAFCEAKICPECSDHKICNRRCLTQCMPTAEPYDLLVEFAKSEREELTRWSDPDELRPDNMQRVLVKYKKADGSTKVGIATFHNPFGIGRGSFVMEASLPRYIIGWREIHE